MMKDSNDEFLKKHASKKYNCR